MFVYLFGSQCTCQYITVTVGVAKQDSLGCRSQCSIHTSSCCNYEGYMYTVTCTLAQAITRFTLCKNVSLNLCWTTVWEFIVSWAELFYAQTFITSAMKMFIKCEFKIISRNIHIMLFSICKALISETINFQLSWMKSNGELHCNLHNYSFTADWQLHLTTFNYSFPALSLHYQNPIFWLCQFNPVIRIKISDVIVMLMSN